MKYDFVLILSVFFIIGSLIIPSSFAHDEGLVCPPAGFPSGHDVDISNQWPFDHHFTDCWPAGHSENVSYTWEDVNQEDIPLHEKELSKIFIA